MRKIYVDYIKAIGIILVIIGHINFANSNYGIKEWIYAFHMPLFFFATGLVIKENKINGRFLKKKLKSLMVPYFIWGLIYCEFSLRNFAYIVYGSYNTLIRANTLTSIWFLPAMLTGVILVQIVFTITKNIYFHIGFMALFAFIGIYGPKIERGYPWCVDVGVLAASFILFGYIFEKFFGEHKFTKANRCVLLMVVGVIGTLLFKCNKVQGSSNVLMARRCLGNPILFFITAVFGCIMVYGLTQLLIKFSGEKHVILEYIGTNTLAIFATHKPIIKVCERLFLHLNSPWFIELIFTTIITLFISCIAVAIINGCIPELNGKPVCYKK